MKTIAVYLAFFLAIQPEISLFCQNETDEIIKAYELRMDGHSEGAIDILTKVLESNPQNAMAHFEMARSLENDNKNDHINKALEYDPGNLAYNFYQANLQMLEAYKGMKTNNKEMITKNLDLCKVTLKHILTLEPDCKETLMFLVDIYGSLPEEMGGNREIAETYLNTLRTVDPLYAAQGELTLKLKEGDVDLVEYWKDYLAASDDSNEALIKLGKAYLMSDDIEKAQEPFNRVIKSDSAQAILYLDVARAYLYTAMRGGDGLDESLKAFKENIHRYLDTAVKKPKLIEAWCYGWLGMVESKQGNTKQADEYSAKAKKLITNYPRYTALPTIDQPPNSITYQYRSYFSPF